MFAAMPNVKEVAGSTIWPRFFGDKNVDPQMYVPFQLGTILNTSLMRAEATLKKIQMEFDYTQEAQGHFAMLQAGDVAAKKNRSGPYSQ